MRHGHQTDFQITQGVEMGRQSEINVRVTLGDGGKGNVEKVELSGCAVQVTEGNIRL